MKLFGYWNARELAQFIASWKAQLIKWDILQNSSDLLTVYILGEQNISIKSFTQ